MKCEYIQHADGKVTLTTADLRQQPAQQPVCDLCEGTGVAVDHEGGRSMGCPRGCLRTSQPAQPESGTHIKCIEVGNWYSEYQCMQCGAKWVQDDDAPHREHHCKAPPDLTAAQQPAQSATDERGRSLTYGGDLAQPGSGEVRNPYGVEELRRAFEITQEASKGMYVGLPRVTLEASLVGHALRAYDNLQQQLTAARQRIAALESELATERARGIHTCHDQCQRPLCVAQRRIAELEGVGQCICPKCGIRHGSNNTDGGF